ncbi:hypothetical protein BD324DRAFT_617350 [Kockovaella imperatae]|uniref:Uncharacterized protein n=1 Tax=Kockovaella imperatae TaxID=4999 RepID=A0A1Y1US98_9TREE|nr:hypothetical protein BD324DRAFT_617350 [Kockovaella imperatae]ORX40326.1 hypothetical protein BD324DRAFT_617350 [Kockovaella imperatae]
MFSIKALSIIGALVGMTAAYDERMEVKKPDGMSMQLFERAFFSACYGFEPIRTVEGPWFGPDAFFQPGDYQGKNNETIALASCTYFNDYHHPVGVTAGVAQLLGGNTTEPCPYDVCTWQYQADGTYLSGLISHAPDFGYQYNNFSTWGCFKPQA